ncbi:MAG: hypothetical protein K1X94_14610 [Sandaracinaceae bacterium]|nr:hypothetical protein [Sandaracinaceae bacterium]
MHPNASIVRRPALALVLLALAATGCGAAQRPSGSAQACAVGDWRGTGEDEGGTHWEFTLVLREEGPDLVGAFHWVGSDGSVGDEQIRGHADCGARTFEWQGESATGGSDTMDVVTGHYTGTFGDDLASFSGRWVGGTPGTLQGTR